MSLYLLYLVTEPGQNRREYQDPAKVWNVFHGRVALFSFTRTLSGPAFCPHLLETAGPVLGATITGSKQNSCKQVISK